MLLLFDIDGTLIHAHGVGRRAIEDAMSQAAGRPIHSKGVTFAGRTDPAIAWDMLRISGVPDDECPTLVDEGLRRYSLLVDHALAEHPVTVLPGVFELLDRLSAIPTVRIALLTGNLESSAYAKLRSGGLDSYFPFGAFGSDHADRYRLPFIALGRAWTFTGRRYAPDECIILGDTEHDVGCGRGAGMRTVAVCTGPHDRVTMESHGADLVLDDFSAPSALFGMLDPAI